MKGWWMKRELELKEWLKKEVDGVFGKPKVAGTKANSGWGTMIKAEGNSEHQLELSTHEDKVH